MGSLRFAFRLLLVALVLASDMVMLGMADTAKDIEECADQLAGMATCLNYVQGQAKAPTPDCCNGLKQVLKNNKKCLCVIIKDRQDPQLGLQINVTLALGLPSVCHAPADVGKCPALLHLDPKSPDAQVFYRFANMTNDGASGPAPSPIGGSDQASTPGGRAASAQQKSGGCCSAKRWLGLEALSFGIFIWFFSN